MANYNFASENRRLELLAVRGSKPKTAKIPEVLELN